MIRKSFAILTLSCSLAVPSFATDVPNATFDGSASGWSALTFRDTLGWQKIDAEHAPGSGAMAVNRQQEGRANGGGGGAMQCVSILPGTYDAGAKIMIPGQQGRASAHYGGTFYTSTDCSGSYVGYFYTDPVSATSNGTFTPVARRGITVPVGVQSARLELWIIPEENNANVTVLYDDVVIRPAGGCVPDDQVMCLSDGRIAVSATYTAPGAEAANAHVIQLTNDTAYMWFFTPNNVEVTMKALNACAVNNRQWVFASGLTNVQVDITVTDTKTHLTRTYRNAQGSAFAPIFDTDAFVCP